MKNILMHATVSEMNNIAIEKFFSEYYSDNNVLVYDISDECNFNPQIPKENQYISDKMGQHQYREVPGYYDSSPIDTKLIEQILPYQSMILKMMDTYYPEVSSFYDRQNILLNAVRLLNSIIEKHKIDLFINFGVPHQVYDYIMYVLCCAKKIKTFIIYRLPLRGYLYFFNTIEHQDIFFERRESKIEELSEDFYNLYLKYSKSQSYIKPYYMEDKSLRDRIKKTKRHLIALKKYIRSPKTVIQTILLTNQRRVRERYIKKNSNDNISNKKFIYVALHYQPEATTAPLAGIFVNQQLIVQLLSYCVPDDVILCVKEHPMQGIRGDLKKGFFKELVELRNVELVPTFLDSNFLLENCMAVATCTGTIALEAMFKNKPALLFGHYVYNYMPNVFNIHTVEDGKKAINNIMNKQEIEISEQDKINYVAMLDRVKYHAEFVKDEKMFMVSNGVSVDMNNATLSKMLNDIMIKVDNDNESI